MEKVKVVIAQHPQAIVAVELDQKRFYALLHEQQRSRFSFADVRRVGFTGFLFALIGSYVSRKLGDLVGQKPGADMLAAIKAAQALGLQVALIDQDIEVTLHRFSRALTFHEKLRIAQDIFFAIFFQKSQLKKYGLEQFDLNKVPSTVVIKKLIAHLQQRYPHIYHVLIAERNQFMVKRLQILAQQHPDRIIVAVVGAGHEEGMRELLGI